MWVRNPNMASLGGSGSRRLWRLQSRCQPERQSLKACLQDGSLAWLLAEGLVPHHVDLSLKCPPDTAAGIPQSQWSRREQGGSCRSRIIISTRSHSLEATKSSGGEVSSTNSGRAECQRTCGHIFKYHRRFPLISYFLCKWISIRHQFFLQLLDKRLFSLRCS